MTGKYRRRKHEQEFVTYEPGTEKVVEEVE